mmetsp:Transcript_86307/g.200684  ORF Transcript_86307/g.200684 Transcript_86307/m.200684 type:complete len:234 (-) Transcript_86307:523-1224(-)
MSSIMPMIFSKLTLRPRSAKTKSSMFTAAARLAGRLLCSASAARRRRSRAETWVCKREGLGKVFLKRSRASSSFRILMVSDSARISFMRDFLTSSHSACLVSQLAWRSTRKCWFSASDDLVSPRSSLKVSILMLASPERPSFSSMASVLASASLSLADTIASKFALLFSSAVVASARASSMVSFICFNMPMTSLVEAPELSPRSDRKDDSTSRSELLMSVSTVSLLSTSAVEV